MESSESPGRRRGTLLRSSCRRFLLASMPRSREDCDVTCIEVECAKMPALQTLDELALSEGGRRGFDFAFIDADKPNYFAYFEKLLVLIRPGGLIAVDNTLGLSRT